MPWSLWKKSLNHLWLQFPMRYTTLSILYVCMKHLHRVLVHEWFNESGAQLQQWDENEDTAKGREKEKRTQYNNTHIQISWNRWQLHKTYGGNHIYWGQVPTINTGMYCLNVCTMNQRLVRITIKHWCFWRLGMNWIVFWFSEIINWKSHASFFIAERMKEKCFTAIYIIWIMCVKFVIVYMCSCL